MNRILTPRQVAGHNTKSSTKGAGKKRKFRKVARDKKTGVPKKYLSGSKNAAKKAAEIKRTAERYRKGLPIDVKKVSASRVAQGKRNKRKGSS